MEVKRPSPTHYADLELMMIQLLAFGLGRYVHEVVVVVGIDDLTHNVTLIQY